MTGREPAIVALDAMGTARWDFRDSAARWQPAGRHAGETWDPFPAYPHDLGEVTAAVTWVAGVAALPFELTFYVADREGMARTNGWSHLADGGHYDGDEWVKDPPTGVVVLSGKRIPPHPGMTRHLVAHEYGHHVEWALNMARGEKSPHSAAVTAEYLTVRDLPAACDHHGEGGTWHDSVHEVFACDFRVLGCGVEPDYWPHPGVPRPALVPGLAEWWADAITQVNTAQ